MNLIQRVIAVAFTVGILTFPLVAAASPVTWDEINAGDLVATAETAGGAAGSELGAIRGNLASIAPIGSAPRYQVDLFKIYVSDANLFSAFTLSDDNADTALFLFDDQGHGVYMNDDDSSGSSLLSFLPAGDAASPTQSGFYYLGIALGGYLPYDAFDSELFMPGSFTDVLAGIAAAGSLARWDTPFDAASEAPYSYEIRLIGVQIAQVSEPGSLALVLLGLIAITRRRSRSRYLGA